MKCKLVFIIVVIIVIFVITTIVIISSLVHLQLEFNQTKLSPNLPLLERFLVHIFLIHHRLLTDPNLFRLIDSKFHSLTLDFTNSLDNPSSSHSIDPLF